MYILQGTGHEEVCTLIRNLDTRVSNLEEKFDNYFFYDNDDMSAKF